MDRRGFLFSTLALAGCATTATVLSSGLVLGELEPLYGLRSGRRALTVRVATNGCTDRADFVFYVERTSDVARLAFARRRVDGCRGSGWDRIDLRFTWADLRIRRGTPVQLLNPIAPN